MTTHRVLCFGGRDYLGPVDPYLSQLPTLLGEFCIIHGDARGADRGCGEWARRQGICEIRVPAPWDFYKAMGRTGGAGPTRNQWMLDFCMPTYAVGFPGGAGTADMARRLKAAGVTLWQPLERV